MCSNTKPYWVWALDVAATDRNRKIGTPEMLLLLLDKLENEGFDMMPVVEGLFRLAEVLKDEAAAQTAALFASRSSDSDFIQLKDKFGRLFQAVRQESAMHGADRERGEAVRALLAALDQAVGRFREHVLKVHPRYFERDGTAKPVHLGNMVRCFCILEQIVSDLKQPSQSPAGAVKADPELLYGLLDWDGDLADTMHEYWMEEYRKITGME